MKKAIFITAITISTLSPFLVPHEPVYIGKMAKAAPISLLAAPKHTPKDTLNPVPISPMEYVQSEASKYGWGSGSEWEALRTLVGNESGARPTAQNPKSSAYGIFQFLDSTWASYGCVKTSDPAEQSRCGLKYIKARYGSPSQALHFWRYIAPTKPPYNQHWY